MTAFISRVMQLFRRFGFLVFGFVLPFMTHAQGFSDRVLEGATNASEPSGLTDAGELEVVVGNVINALLSLVGVLLILIMIYAGFLWMTAGGNTDQIKKARSYIINSIIGLVIVFAAYAIVRFVLQQIVGTAIGETAT